MNLSAVERTILLLKLLSIISILTLTCVLLASCGGASGGDVSSDNNIITQTILVNHTTLDVGQITDEALNAARARYMNLDHASVGNNIKTGMEDLKAMDAIRYDYLNWDWHNRGNPGW